MSVEISIRHALKKYSEKVIIPDLSIDIKDGEFFTLLGPSGCGKTTLLRMIAGFNSIEGGDFFFDSKRINDMDPGDRNIGMVFQNYAIFPHMTVRKNVEFGLKNRKVPKETIKMETDRFLELIHIKEYENRMPERLSGGQQQRVALARALVIKPDVLLMDEPLSNLDAKLRVEMRNVIKNIQREVGITTVYVTHDQEEAMAVSDRIAVMKDGVIQQVGKPKDLYQRPSNLFVATFIGRSNILEGSLIKDTDCTTLDLHGARFPLAGLDEGCKEEGSVLVSVRPEEFFITEDRENSIAATVKDCVFLGLNTHYFCELDNGQEIEVVQVSKMTNTIEPGSRIMLGLDLEKINVFNKEGTESLMKGTDGGPK